jgi:Fungal specific transcription factor domain
VQGIAQNASSETPITTIGRPAGHLAPGEDNVSESALPTGTFTSVEVVPVQMPTGTDWDIYWPFGATELPPCPGLIQGEQGWEAYPRPNSTVIDFTFSPSWGFLEDQIIPNLHDTPPLRTRDSMAFFNFAFLANFTSTTGFVNSFDCGTLEERKCVVRSCTTTGLIDFCPDASEVGEEYPADVRSAGNTSEDSDVAVEETPHIWGFILPKKIPMSGARSQSQQSAQVKPLYTESWMQEFSEELCIDPMAAMADSDTTKTLNFNIQHHHRLLSNPLSLMTHEITSRIKEVISLKPRNSIITLTWSSLLEEICLRFFSPPNLLKYMDLYWACWHPNWPVIHKPTFSPVAAHPVLVATMAIVGKNFQVTRYFLRHTDLFRRLYVAWHL